MPSYTSLKKPFLKYFAQQFSLCAVLVGCLTLTTHVALADSENTVRFAPTVFINAGLSITNEQPNISTTPATELNLYSQDLLVYMIWDAYNMALYLPTGAEGKDVFADIPKQIVIDYLVDIDADEFGPAGEEILAKNISKQAMAALRPRLDKINSAYQAVTKGDRYTLTYVPSVGTTLAKNDKALVTIPGEDFAQAYFKIWFGEEPVDKDLRDNLLFKRQYADR